MDGKKLYRIFLVIMMLSFIVAFVLIAFGNTDKRMNFDDSINSTICNFKFDRGLTRIYPCDSSFGYYLSTDDFTNKKLSRFFGEGSVKLVKSKRDSIVYLLHVFKLDTLKLLYEVDEDSSLTEGKLFKSSD